MVVPFALGKNSKRANIANIRNMVIRNRTHNELLYTIKLGSRVRAFRTMAYVSKYSKKNMEDYNKRVTDFVFI